MLPSQSMARSPQRAAELQRMLDASEKEVQCLVTAQLEVSRPQLPVPLHAYGVSGLGCSSSAVL